jgi:NMDA receptor-regulated protein 1
MPLTVPPTSNEDKALEPPPVKDEDLDGSKLLASPDALELAAKFLSPVVAIVKDNIDVWIATYDVAIRRSEFIFTAQHTVMKYFGLSLQKSICKLSKLSIMHDG